MYFSELSVVLSSCICFGDAIGFFGLGNSFRVLLRDVNVTSETFGDPPPVKTKWIEQPLDHFNASETSTWRMRYFERLDLWKKGGPIYLFIYGEGPAGPTFLKTGILYELAKETKGAMFLSEHRFYGKSKPFDNLTVQNLMYLSSRQALADTANLLQTIKMTSKFNSSKVVVVGGSYAGNLAAWMKLLYPNIVDAAIASSAPVLAKTDFHEYLEVVRDDFEQYGTEGCLTIISDIFKRYEKLFGTPKGIAQLKEEENICNNTDMTKLENMQIFFMDKASVFMANAQYGTTDTIKDHCIEISQSSRVLSVKDDESSNWSKRDDCFNYDFYENVEESKKIDWLTAWMYQSCTEFGYFQSSSSTSDLFTKNIPAELFATWCMAAFGSEFNMNQTEEGVTKTNNLYGGCLPNVTNVVFVNGGLDPWSKLGVLEDISYEAPAEIIPRVSHCSDLFSDSHDDPQELKDSRKYIKYLIKKWIGAGEFIKAVS
ncbi:hypothetical protein K1T71_001694 [Dendrolimus kikuchii]|uniref:Uncharacterized protein n=1 Tax=Dendrolimus kikuchii TaxID=765133 RepID=A0ACC1DEN1_9NEOP|nr:hypothetical protein K1T71_001694 [Dendrolimus kikuchii]